MHVQVHMHVSMWRHKDNFSYYSSDTVHFRFFLFWFALSSLGLQGKHFTNRTITQALKLTFSSSHWSSLCIAELCHWSQDGLWVIHSLLKLRWKERRAPFASLVRVAWLSPSHAALGSTCLCFLDTNWFQVFFFFFFFILLIYILILKGCAFVGRDSAIVKGAYCSFRVPEFGSQNPHWVAYNFL